MFKKIPFFCIENRCIEKNWSRFNAASSAQRWEKETNLITITSIINYLFSFHRCPFSRSLVYKARHFKVSHFLSHLSIAFDIIFIAFVNVVQALEKRICLIIQCKDRLGWCQQFLVRQKSFESSTFLCALLCTLTIETCRL